MQQADDKLMRALTTMRIEPADARFTFQDRLAQENGWSSSFVQRVIIEYHRFLFMAATANQPVTPSDEIDQAWHLHLTYSRHYWDVLCKKILCKPLHHGPTEGGMQEDMRYANQYTDTLQLYEACFGEPPPDDIWPAIEKRFSGRFRRIDISRQWMVPKVVGYSAVGTFALAGCTTNGGDPLIAFGLIAAITVGSYLVVRFNAFTDTKKKKNDGSGCGAGGGCGTSSSNSDSGCGGGGCGGGCGS
jgi:hypothetical protein